MVLSKKSQDIKDIREAMQTKLLPIPPYNTLHDQMCTFSHNREGGGLHLTENNSHSRGESERIRLQKSSFITRQNVLFCEVFIMTKISIKYCGGSYLVV